MYYSGNEVLRSESVMETNGKYALSRIEFTALSSDNNLLLTCKGQVENFRPRITSFVLNITCKLLEEFEMKMDFIV